MRLLRVTCIHRVRVIFRRRHHRNGTPHRQVVSILANLRIEYQAQ